MGVARIKELITESRKCGRPIIYIQHINPPDDYFFLEGTHGAEISERIKPCAGDKVIVKHFPNSFLETELNDYLLFNEIKHFKIFLENNF